MVSTLIIKHQTMIGWSCWSILFPNHYRYIQWPKPFCLCNLQCMKCSSVKTISFSVCRTCITRVPDSCGGGWCPDPPAPHSLHYLLLQGGQVLLLQVQFGQRWPPATRQGGLKPSPVQWSKRKWVQATASWPGEVIKSYNSLFSYELNLPGHHALTLCIPTSLDHIMVRISQ